MHYKVYDYEPAPDHVVAMLRMANGCYCAIQVEGFAGLKKAKSGRPTPHSVFLSATEMVTPSAVIISAEEVAIRNRMWLTCDDEMWLLLEGADVGVVERQGDLWVHLASTEFEPTAMRKSWAGDLREHGALHPGINRN